jgi:hypothetical protein
MTCSDCGATLTADAPVVPPAAEKPRDLPWPRIALTVLAPLLVLWLGPKLHVPRLDERQFASTLGAFTSEGHLSVLALGLNPMLSAFVIVELAALCVPRWRSLRIGGPSGRGRLLLATGRLALALAIVQSLGIAIYLEKAGMLEADARFSRLVVVLTLVAGTFALAALAQFLDHAALGGGFSVLVMALTLPSLSPFGRQLWRGLTTPDAASSGQATLVGGALVLACAGTAFFLKWRPRDAEGKRSALPLPACGVIPLRFAAMIATPVIAALALRPEPWLAFDTWQNAAIVTLTLTAAFAIGLGFLFNRPSKVAAFGPDAWRRVRRAVTHSTGYVLGLGSLGWFLGAQPGFEAIDLVPLVVLVAVVLDVIAEARAIQAHGELVPVWPEHRLYAVEGARDALERSGIPSLARSVHQRALWHFFAPAVPVQLMVPGARAEEASTLLHEYFQTRDPARAAREASLLEHFE